MGLVTFPLILKSLVLVEGFKREGTKFWQFLGFCCRNLKAYLLLSHLVWQGCQTRGLSGGHIACWQSCRGPHDVFRFGDHHVSGQQSLM